MAKVKSKSKGLETKVQGQRLHIGLPITPRLSQTGKSTVIAESNNGRFETGTGKYKGLEVSVKAIAIVKNG